MPIHMHNTVCKNVVMHLYISIFENDKKNRELCNAGNLHFRISKDKRDGK